MKNRVADMEAFKRDQRTPINEPLPRPPTWREKIRVIRKSKVRGMATRIVK